MKPTMTRSVQIDDHVVFVAFIPIGIVKDMVLIRCPTSATDVAESGVVLEDAIVLPHILAVCLRPHRCRDRDRTLLCSLRDNA